MVNKLCNLYVELVSIDQEKSFDSINHSHVFKMIEAFGIGPVFSSYISLFYQNIFSVLKINGVLAAPSQSAYVRLPSVWDIVCPESGAIHSSPKKPFDWPVCARVARCFPILSVSLWG